MFPLNNLARKGLMQLHQQTLTKSSNHSSGSCCNSDSRSRNICDSSSSDSSHTSIANNRSSNNGNNSSLDVRYKTIQEQKTLCNYQSAHFTDCHSAGKKTHSKVESEYGGGGGGGGDNFIIGSKFNDAKTLITVINPWETKFLLRVYAWKCANKINFVPNWYIKTSLH